MNRSIKLLAATSAIALGLATAAPAYANGTAVGTTITNTVSVDFQVGGIAQNAVAASDSFVVDRKVDLTVAEVGGTTTQVSPGQTQVVTTFQVTNLSNDTLDFGLSVAQADGGAGPHGGTDNFNVSNVAIYRDTNNDGVWDAGDELVTYLDEVAADDSVTVFVVADVPLGRATDDVAVVTLTAQARAGGTGGSQGAVLTQTVGANTAGVDTVFADGAGVSDAPRDGTFSASDSYTVLAAALSATKTSRIVSDPFNGTTDPKAIPGAVIEYCIAVANASGSATASNIAVSDTLPGELTFQSGSIRLNGSVTGSTCNADGVAGGDFTDPVVSGALADIAAGETRTLVFRAVID